MQDDCGYIGIGPEGGKFVSDENAFDYALERALRGNEEETREFREMLVEWYYAGNWIKT